MDAVGSSTEWGGSDGGSPNDGRTGERLFGETSVLKPMRLVETRSVGDCLVLTIYRPVRDA